MSPTTPPACSQCGSALPSSASAGQRCARCEPATAGDESRLVAVLETADSGLLAVVKSLLDGAEIPYLVQGDEAMSLFPLGAFGKGPFRHGVGAVVRVPPSHARDAEALLEGAAEAELEEGALPTLSDHADDPEAEP